jgi:hypothetical protein
MVSRVPPNITPQAEQITVKYARQANAADCRSR